MLAGNDRGWRAGDLLIHNEIEVDPRKRLVEASLMDLTCVANALDMRDQLVAGAECEIIVQILVARDVDLGRELAVAGGRDEEVHVRRPVAMAVQRLQQLLGLAAGRTGVAARHDRTESGAAILVRLDSATEVIGRLRRVEMRVVAHRVGMPDVNHGAGDRLPQNVADLAFHEHHLTVVGTVVEPHLALRKRRPSDVERPLDGAHGGTGEPGAPLRLIESKIEKMLEHDARYDQSELGLLARLSEVGNAGPELVHRDVEVVDGDHQVDQEAIDYLLQARVALAIIQAGGTGGQSSYHVLLDQIGWHLSILLRLHGPTKGIGRGIISVVMNGSPCSAAGEDHVEQHITTRLPLLAWREPYARRSRRKRSSWSSSSSIPRPGHPVIGRVNRDRRGAARVAVGEPFNSCQVGVE